MSESIYVHVIDSDRVTSERKNGQETSAKAPNRRYGNMTCSNTQINKAGEVQKCNVLINDNKVDITDFVILAYSSTKF